MLGHLTIFRRAMTCPGEMHRDRDTSTASRDSREQMPQRPRAQASHTGG